MITIRRFQSFAFSVSDLSLSEPLRPEEASSMAVVAGSSIKDSFGVRFERDGDEGGCDEGGVRGDCGWFVLLRSERGGGRGMHRKEEG